MSDEANIAGVVIAIIAVSAIAGPQLSHSATTSSSTRTTTSATAATTVDGADDDAEGAQATQGCVAGHAVGEPAAIRLDGSTVATVTQYYGTCGGAGRNWTTVLFTPAALQKYSTQARAAIVANGRTMGAQSVESTSGVTSSPVATTGICTSSTATVRLVRRSDGQSFGPLTASTARHC